MVEIKDENIENVEHVEYAKELGKFEEDGEFEDVPRWLPPNGRWKIRFEGEINPYVKEYSGEQRERGALNLVELKKNEKFVIFFSRSRKKGTTYHKLVRLAEEHGKGKLDGLEVEVLTNQNEMNGNKYVEYIFPILFEEGDKEKGDGISAQV